MSRSANLSPLGLYNWDNTIFDLMSLPSALDKNVLVSNLLAETAELEVLYPNPVIFKNLVGVWSAKQLDIWNRLYATTQYEYNPIENYNRYETGTDAGTGSTTHSGTDTTTDTATHGGADRRTETLETGGKDVTDMSRRGEGTETSATSFNDRFSGSDKVAGNETKGHWIAGFDSAPTETGDGLVKQTRDENEATTTTTYGKHESSNGQSNTTNERTETNTDETTYGKTENVDEIRTYGQTITKTGAINHGEQITNENNGEHQLHAHGNIGVTTTQQMIQDQREVDRFNVYDIIIEDFKMRFCILVY